MVQTLDAIKGGGGSIKVGATGTIGALMSRELEYTTTRDASKKKAPTRSATLPSSATAFPAKPKSRRASADEAASSSATTASTICNDRKSSQSFRKGKQTTRKTHEIPIIDAENISIDGTPIKEKPDRKVSCMVEIVDIKCGNPDKAAWASPIASRLRKLGFSKLSESII